MQTYFFVEQFWTHIKNIRKIKLLLPCLSYLNSSHLIKIQFISTSRNGLASGYWVSSCLCCQCLPSTNSERMSLIHLLLFWKFILKVPKVWTYSILLSVLHLVWKYHTHGSSTDHHLRKAHKFCQKCFCVIYAPVTYMVISSIGTKVYVNNKVYIGY